MEIVIIIWILCGIVSAMIANSKGLSVALWFFVGLVLGIIGVILAAIATKDDPGKFTTSLNNWVCPRCGMDYSYAVSRCTRKIMQDGSYAICNTPRPEYAPQPALAPAEKKCPQCAEMVKAEAKICRFSRYEF